MEQQGRAAWLLVTMLHADISHRCRLFLPKVLLYHVILPSLLFWRHRFSFSELLW